MTASPRHTRPSNDHLAGSLVQVGGNDCRSAGTPLERVLESLARLEDLIDAELAAMPRLPPGRGEEIHSLLTALRENTAAHADVDQTSGDRADAERQRRRQLLEAVFENTHEGLVVLNLSGEICDANGAFLALTGRSVTQTLGRPLCSVLEWAFAEYEDVLHSAASGNPWSGRVVLAQGDRSERTYLLSFSRVQAPELSDHIVVLFSDVTPLERTQRRFKRLALHDQLTGLPNRRFCRERIQSLIESCRQDNSSFAVCFIDLDDFKEVNDSLGHTAGDELLVQVARRLRQQARDETFVARLGGDEFAMLISHTDRDLRRTATVADDILTALREPIDIGGTMASVGASMGITEFPTHSTRLDELLQNADVAMYAAKRAGRNQVCVFTPEMRIEVEQRNRIFQELQRALKGNEISLWYQPQVDLRTGCLSGCEALARWRTPDGRDIMPNEFVPVAESSGLVIPLGELVLMEACRQACEWEEMGLRPPRIAVNISPQHLHSRHFVERTAEILDVTGAQADWLMLEITEDAVMQDLRQAMQTMDELAELGLTLAIDDYGTGRSSFRYLKQFNIHALKIDRSFLTELATDPQTCSIVESMIHLGQGRQLQMVAVGVENQEQYELLCTMGCDVGQGFHIARPLRATALECWWDDATL